VQALAPHGKIRVFGCDEVNGWSFWVSTPFVHSSFLPKDWWNLWREEVRSERVEGKRTGPYCLPTRKAAEDAAARAFARLPAERRAVLGQPQRALEFYQQSLVVCRADGDRRGEIGALGYLGAAYAALGQPQRALECSQQRLDLMRACGDLRGEAFACWELGLRLADLNRLEEAVALMQVCVRFEQEVGLPDAQRLAARVEQLRRRLLP
jgi:tetratricopeptide (TPR) repeat protein